MKISVDFIFAFRWKVKTKTIFFCSSSNFARFCSWIRDQTNAPKRICILHNFAILQPITKANNPVISRYQLESFSVFLFCIFLSELFWFRSNFVANRQCLLFIIDENISIPHFYSLLKSFAVFSLIYGRFNFWFKLISYECSSEVVKSNKGEFNLSLCIFEADVPVILDYQAKKQISQLDSVIRWCLIHRIFILFINTYYSVCTLENDIIESAFYVFILSSYSPPPFCSKTVKAYNRK